MRTTLDIDDDVLSMARERARREKRSLGAVVSELARDGVRSASPRPADTGVLGFRPLPARGPIVTNDVIDRLREDDSE